MNKDENHSSESKRTLISIDHVVRVKPFNNLPLKRMMMVVNQKAKRKWTTVFKARAELPFDWQKKTYAPKSRERFSNCWTKRDE